MSYRPIISEKDIDSLRRGDRVDFFPPEEGLDLGSAVFLGRDSYGKMEFAYMMNGDVGKVSINRHHLTPASFDSLGIQDRVTVSLLDADVDEIVCFENNLGNVI